MTMLLDRRSLLVRLIGGATGALWLPLAGCAASGPRFAGLRPPPPGQALLVLYRPSALVAAATWPEVLIDDRPVGLLRAAGYLRLVLPPGEHRINLPRTANRWIYDDPALVLRLMADRRHFVRVSPHLATLDLKRPETALDVSVVSEERAMQELPLLNESV